MGYQFMHPDEEFDELTELERIYARRRRRQRVWAVLAVIIAVSMLTLYILADFFRANRRSDEPPDVEIRAAAAPLVPGPAVYL